MNDYFCTCHLVLEPMSLTCCGICGCHLVVEVRCFFQLGSDYNHPQSAFTSTYVHPILNKYVCSRHYLQMGDG